MGRAQEDIDDLLKLFREAGALTPEIEERFLKLRAESADPFEVYDGICAKLPIKWIHAIAYNLEDISIPLLLKVAPMLKGACDMLAKETGVGHGYSIDVRNEFVYEYDDFLGGSTPLLGPFLTLSGKGGKRVGVLEFRVGIPFDVMGIQGQNQDGPMEFFRATGKNFDTVLLDHLIHCVGYNLHFPAYDRELSVFRSVPKAELNITGGISPAIVCHMEKNGDLNGKVLAALMLEGLRLDKAAEIAGLEDGGRTKLYSDKGGFAGKAPTHFAKGVDGEIIIYRYSMIARHLGNYVPGKARADLMTGILPMKTPITPKFFAREWRRSPGFSAEREQGRRIFAAR